MKKQGRRESAAQNTVIMSECINFEIDGAKITVFPAKKEGRPVIYLNSYEGAETYQRLGDMECRDLNLVAIGVRDWFCDLVPWEITSPFRDGRKFVGGATGYLRILTDKIVPAAEKILPAASWRGIAGYSLGGLFAVWAMYNTSSFTRVASCSGSFWFEGFMPYIYANQLQCRPRCAYFSLGDREAGKVSSPVHSVADNTRRIADTFGANGAKTTFVWERGGHNDDPVGRVARGIKWLSGEY